MSSAVLKGNASGTGIVTIESPNTNTDRTITLPDATGTLMAWENIPVFAVYASAQNNLTNNTFTKITLNTEEFDSAGYFDSTTNYRFTPLVAGYYQFICAINVNAAASGVVIAAFFKNGSEFKRCGQTSLNSASTNSPGGSAIIYMNGSTDYVELYCLQNSGGTVATSNAGAPYVYMAGSLIRKA